MIRERRRGHVEQMGGRADEERGKADGRESI